MADSYNELFGLGSHAGNGAAQSRIALWWLNEASGNAIDAEGGNDLTETSGTIDSAVGLYGKNCRDFEAGDTEHFAIASNSDVQTGDVDWTILMRVQLESKSTFRFMLAKDGNTSVAGNREYAILYDVSSDRFLASCFVATDSIRTATANNLGSPSLATWYFIAGWHDAAGDTINIAVNDGTPDSTATGGALQAASSAEFRIGSRVGTANLPHDGLIDTACLFKRVLTSGERTDAYAGPEPINSVAPAVSGTETEGETLSVTNGTWGLDAPFSGGTNGTITYAYQWTRSDDAIGTGEADIGSATASTYVLQAADVGKFIRCRVRATNDGGFDAAADTNSDFTGSIAAAGGGGTFAPIYDIYYRKLLAGAA